MASQRTVVVTGGSAGVGRAIVHAFARRGWNVAVLARDQAGLADTQRAIEQAGGVAMTIALDVADAEAVFGAAERIIERFGVIDVWVNNAMVTVFSPVSDMSPAEYRRATEVTYLGYVHGTLAALKHMRARNGGTIVQVGSALSYRAIPLQSAYCAAKFAIRGFTDALRSELLHDKSGIRLTMVQLPAVNTPQFDWARNKLPVRTQPVPPIYQPDPVGEHIFQAAQHAPRESWIGFATAKAILANMIAPGLLDRYLAREGYQGQLTSEPHSETPGNLFEPVAAGHAMRGRFGEKARAKVTAYDPAALRGLLAGIILLLVIIFLAALAL